MCLITPQTVPSETTSEMVVWKIMQKNRFGQMVSIYQHFRYLLQVVQPKVLLKLNCLPESRDQDPMCDVDADYYQDHFRTDPAVCGSWRRNQGLYSISEGYHSLVPGGKFTKQIWDNVRIYPHRDYVMVKCIIPAGIKYYMNGVDMIVSETIVYTGEIIAI